MSRLLPRDLLRLATVGLRTRKLRAALSVLGISIGIAALVAIGGERFAVLARGPGGRRRIVVTPGLAADGYVQVEGAGLRAGMRVETGE